MSLIEMINAFFAKLPFKGMMEEIPAEKRAKVPVLNKVIPFANQIVCGLVVVLLVTVIASSGGKKGSGSSRKSGKVASSASDFTYELNEDGTGIKITGFTRNDVIRVAVPSKIEDIPVVEIGEMAFSGKSLVLTNKGASVGSSSNSDIISITIPNTVTKIGDNAFDRTNITSFNMPDSVTEIGDSIFNGCYELTEVRFSDNLTYIPNGTLSMGMGSSKLKKVNLPKNIKEIGWWAFHSNAELTELIIPDNLKSIRFVDRHNDMPDNSAFGGCGKLPIKTRQALKDLGYEGRF